MIEVKCPVPRCGNRAVIANVGDAAEGFEYIPNLADSYYTCNNVPALHEHEDPILIEFPTDNERSYGPHRRMRKPHGNSST